MDGAMSIKGQQDWWRDAVIYQIYPRSFADANADGIGDLPGITERLPYLVELGVDAIWLSPFYPSPMADGGYDITDYRDVDPRFGTLEDFDRLVEQAHRGHLRVLIDIVPNHTSEQHPWFVAAIAAGPGAPERERYVIRPGRGPRGERAPTDWRSHFGGSAWQRLPDGEWYSHLFAREQPDLNWDNPEVRQYFLDTLRFWADRGVDGFRVDVAHALAKDLAEPLRSQPNLDRYLPLDGTDPLYDRDEVHDIYRSWRTVFNEYDPPRMAVAETWHPTSARTYLYARPTELGQVFDFSLLKTDWNAEHFARVIQRSMADHQDVGGGLTWVLSSHDVPRHATRYALPTGVDLDSWLLGDGQKPEIDPDVARRRARAATMLMLALPGSAYLYQGEELGLLEVADLPPGQLHDPVYERSHHQLKGRDGCRVPLPWTAHGPSFGFGARGSWLPQPSWYRRYAVDQQTGQPESHLELYRTALALRRKLRTDDDVVWVEHPDRPGVLHLRRSNGWNCLTNFTSEQIPMPAGHAVLRSMPSGEPELVEPETTIWFETDA
jgi:alpha-glucosidase